MLAKKFTKSMIDDDDNDDDDAGTHTHTQQSDVRINGKLIFSSEENESGTQVRREKTEGKEQVFY